MKHVGASAAAAVHQLIMKPPRSDPQVPALGAYLMSGSWFTTAMTFAASVVTWLIFWATSYRDRPPGSG